MKQRRLSPNDGGNGITEGVIWKQLLLFFFPILLGTFFQQLYNTADAIIVGKFVGKEALAAVGGATGNLINLLVGFFVGLSSGASVIISQYYGARKNAEVSASVHTAAALALAGGLLMTVLSYFLLPGFLVTMGTPVEILDQASTYTRIISLGMLPSLIYNIGSGILRAIGDSRRPLYFLIACCLFNIVADVLLVVGANMGVAGAALATILSQLLSAVLVIVTLCRTQQSYQLRPREIRFHGAILQRILQIGFPAGLQSVLYSVSNIIIQASMNVFGTDVLAAWTAYGKLSDLYWMIISAFGIAITTFTGQNFGAGKYDRMHKSVRVCLLLSAIATVLLSSVLMLGARVFLGMFTNDEIVLDYGVTIMWMLVPSYVTYICIEILSGAVRGAGDTLIPTIVNLTGICVLRVVWIWFVVPSHNTVECVLFSYPLTWVVTSIAFVIYYLKGGWLQRCIQKSGLEKQA